MAACGSDLHYFHHGGFGTVRIKEPLIPGHEIAGEVLEAGAAVTRVKPGDRVAVNPSRPCGQCEYCLEGKPRHCLDMRFMGSAMRFPHVQGGFREVLVCSEAQAVPIPGGLSLEHAAFAEPLSVCLHAANQAGQLMGRRRGELHAIMCEPENFEHTVLRDAIEQKMPRVPHAVLR